MEHFREKNRIASGFLCLILLITSIYAGFFALPQKQRNSGFSEETSVFLTREETISDPNGKAPVQPQAICRAGGSLAQFLTAQSRREQNERNFFHIILLLLCQALLAGVFYDGFLRTLLGMANNIHSRSMIVRFIHLKDGRKA